MLGAVAEEAARRGIDAIGAATKIDAVEIQLEDLVLGELALQRQGQHRLLDLAGEGAVIGQEDVARQLLGDGRPALAEMASLDPDLDRPGDADRVDADAARREGSLSWYTSTPVDLAQQLADTFQKETGIKVQLLRTGGQALGWGFQLQQPVTVAAFALLVFAVGLNLSGVFEVPGLGAGEALARRGGHVGAFFTGVLAVAVAAPCTAPFMAAALGYALTQSVIVALLVFVSLGIGFAAPFVAIGFSPALLRMLPYDQYPGGIVSPANFINGSSLHDIEISGTGAIDGQGSPWWPG